VGSVHWIIALAEFLVTFTAVGAEGIFEVVKVYAVVPALGADKEAAVM